MIRTAADRVSCMKEIAEHPLLRQFWRNPGEQWADNHSMTEDDFSYTVELDEAKRARVCERRHSQYSVDAEVTQTFEGLWEPLRILPGEVILRLNGVDKAGAPEIMFLQVTGKDINFGKWQPWIEGRLKDVHERQLLSIEPAEAVARGLPSLRLVADIDGLDLVPRLFPDPDTYATLTTATGKRIFGVYPVQAPVVDAAGLEALVRLQSGAEPHFTLGLRGTTHLQLSSRPTQLYFTGTGDSALAHGAVAIADPGLLFVLSNKKSPWPEKDFDAIAGWTTFVQILRTLSWSAG
jgi:hypothetical protein